MKRINKDGLVVVALFAALIGFSLFNVLQSNERQKEAQRPYDSNSAADRGTLALHNWLQAIGYRPRRIMASPLSADEARALTVSCV